MVVKLSAFTDIYSMAHGVERAEMMEVDGAVGEEREHQNSFEGTKEFLENLEKAGVEGVEEMAIVTCLACGVAWIEQLPNLVSQRKRIAICPSALCGKQWCRSCSRECHTGMCAPLGNGKMQQWRLPVQGFSLRTVMFSREFSDQPDSTEFYRAEAIIRRGLSMASGLKGRFDVKKVEIVENPRLKRKFEEKKIKEIEEGNAGESLLLFHGTPKENILPIVQYNFDPSIVKHGRVHGDGVYFSECPEVSLRYSCLTPSLSHLPDPEEEDGTFSLILCEVLKGSLPGFKEVPIQGFDNRVPVIVVTDIDRLLPRYVATLRRTPSRDPSNLPPPVPRQRSSKHTVAQSGNLVRRLTGLQSSSPGSSATTLASQNGSTTSGSSSSFPTISLSRSALRPVSGLAPSTPLTLSRPPLPSGRPAWRASVTVTEPFSQDQVFCILILRKEKTAGLTKMTLWLGIADVYFQIHV